METYRCVECHTLLPVEELIRHHNAYVCASCKPRFLQKLTEGVGPQAAGIMQYAGFWRRLAALIIDAVVLYLINIPLLFLIIVPLSMGSIQGDGAAQAIVVLLVYGIQIGVNLAYETVLIWKYGATVGKMACQIRIVTADGGSISYPLSLGRYFAKMLSALTLGIGFIMAAFDVEKRSLHDRICNTRAVVK